MKHVLIFSLLLAAFAGHAQTTEGPVAPQMKNENDSMSYFLGLSLGYDISTLPFDISMDLIVSGLTGALSGNATHDRQTTETYFRELQMAFQAREAEKAEQVATENLSRGQDFMKEASGKEGAVTTPSGLVYEVLVKGEGPTPADTSVVRVHYEGSLINGTVFDSSYDRGEPISFPLNRVIRGWTEGVQLMPVGSTYRFYIPSELGYGARESGPIPANSVLIFKIELLGIE